MQPITRGCLCNLHPPNCGIAVQDHSQVWSGFQSILQSPNSYPEPVARNLYHPAQWAPGQANGRLCSGEPLIANYAGFRGSSVLHYDYKRNQTSI